MISRLTIIQLPSCVPSLCHDFHHDNKFSHDLRLCSRWRITGLKVLHESQSERRNAIECSDFDHCLGCHLWLYFSWFIFVSMSTSVPCSYYSDAPSAFNAIISASVVALGISYAIPPAINCLRGRKMLPPRPFKLSGPLGWFYNLVRLNDPHEVSHGATTDNVAIAGHRLRNRDNRPFPLPA